MAERHRINRYREPGRTLTFDVAGVLTASKTRSVAIRNTQSVHIAATDNLTTMDIGISTTEAFLIPHNGVTKFLCVVAPHRFRIMHRALETDEFVLLTVCEGIFLNTGPMMGQYQIVGDYVDPIRCSLSYS